MHFINSAAITVPSVVLVVAISSLAAYALARLKFFARDIWFYLLDHDADVADSDAGCADLSRSTKPWA